MVQAVVIGAGPAGLMAAEMLVDHGIKVLVAEARPSAGRKLLMAGKSGLNLTRDEPFDDFLSQYGDAADWLRPILANFDNRAVQEWARDLGQELFTGSTRRVFPKAMKASPLLRAWLARLGAKGVTLHRRWYWRGWQDDALLFDTPEGLQNIHADATVLALGGASWSRLGSDGLWADILAARGVAITPFQPANAGLAVDWSDHMRRHFGQPVKAVALHAGGQTNRGEWVISARGIEGGGIYALTPRIRQGDTLTLDLLPDIPAEEVARRLSRPRGKASLANHLRKALRLDAIRLALLNEFGRPLPADNTALAHLLKALPIRHAGLRPLDEAISTAGGVARDALTPDLMLQAIPDTWCAGEMMDWEAPTGGYLLTACLATGRWAGLAAARQLRRSTRPSRV
ncbi:MAG: TIGR03862 family flavoprotein [Paracoccaceae bacterium]|nr:TIGR03862 family flavoprotein [Paracoccaceae bacterium]